MASGGLWLWKCHSKKQGRRNGVRCLFIFNFRDGARFRALQIDLNLAVEIGVEIQPTSPEELVPFGAGMQIALASHGLDAVTAILFFSGLCHQCLQTPVVLPQASIFPSVCFLKLACSALWVVRRERSQLELLQCELSPNPTKAKTECIYQIWTPVWTSCVFFFFFLNVFASYRTQ